MARSLTAADIRDMFKKDMEDLKAESARQKEENRVRCDKIWQGFSEKKAVTARLNGTTVETEVVNSMARLIGKGTKSAHTVEDSHDKTTLPRTKQETNLNHIPSNAVIIEIDDDEALIPHTPERKDRRDVAAKRTPVQTPGFAIDIESEPFTPSLRRDHQPIKPNDQGEADLNIKVTAGDKCTPIHGPGITLDFDSEPFTPSLRKDQGIETEDKGHADPNIKFSTKDSSSKMSHKRSLKFNELTNIDTKMTVQGSPSKVMDRRSKMSVEDSPTDSPRSGTAASVQISPTKLTSVFQMTSKKRKTNRGDGRTSSEAHTEEIKAGSPKKVDLSNMPTWYQEISIKDWERKTSRSDTIVLRNLQYIHLRDARRSKDPEALQSVFMALRDTIHRIEFLDTLSPVMVKVSKILEDDGLPVIFQNKIQGVDFPWDLCEDAKVLWQKWMRNDLDSSLLRGLKISAWDEKKKFQRLVLAEGYRARQYSKYRGEGNLANGQWWPYLIAAVRDGAHGLNAGGIYGQINNGAYSILMGEGYADIDEGDAIKYLSTAARDGDESSSTTKCMMLSYRVKNNIRVLRSENLPKHNKYRPVNGYRYDGLYVIDRYELLDEGKSLYRFDMSRVRGQTPIRYQGPEARPTAAELEQFNIIKQQFAWKEQS